MIIRERAIDAGALSGAAALVLAAWWAAGQLYDHPAGAPIAQPAPTVTVTGPATTVHAPPSTPSASSAGAADRSAASAAQPVSVANSASRRPGAGTPSGPAPRPTSTPEPPTPTSCAVGLALLALNECLSLGGSR